MRSTERVALPPFQALVDAYWRDVLRLAAAMAGPVEADDVAQQAWLRAWTSYEDLRSARNLRGWLLTITARCAMDSHRKRSRAPIPTAVLPEVPQRPAPQDFDEPDPELWKAVRALPERQRTAIGLRYVVDLDHPAIARALDTTPAATRRLVSDGLATLRARIAAPTDEGESDA